jgi:hypothetical protein
MTLDLSETFVLDAVSHAYNLDEANVSNERYATGIGEMLFGMLDRGMPGSHRITHDSFFREWSVEEVANLLFVESDTDVATFHPILAAPFENGLVEPAKAAEAVETYPDRFLAYATVDPLAGEAALDELERQVERFDPIGLKLYPSSWGSGEHETWRMDDPRVAYPVFERAQELGVDVIAIHKALAFGPVPRRPYDPSDVDEPAENFPDLTFEVVHGGLAFPEETAWQVARFPNVTVNMEGYGLLLAAGSRRGEEMFGELLSVGGEAVLGDLFWGTGTMAGHAQPQLEAFRDFELSDDIRNDLGTFGSLPQITDEHKRDILGRNYAGLMDIDVEARQAAVADDPLARRRAGGQPEPYATTAAELAGGAS